MTNHLPELRRSLVAAAHRQAERDAAQSQTPSQVGAERSALRRGLAWLRERSIVDAWRQRRWGRLAANFGLSAVFVLGGLAASGAFQRGPAASPEAKLAPEAGLVPGSAQLLEIRTPDPAGGLPWGLREVRTKSGLTCVETGRVDYGTIGLLGTDGAYGNDGRFHPLSTSVYDPFGCANTDAHGHGFMNVALEGVPASGITGDIEQTIGCQPSEDGSPVEAGRTPCPPGSLREIYYGLLGPQARSITYRTAGGSLRSIPTVGPEGAYLIVLPQPHDGCLARSAGGSGGAAKCPFEAIGSRGGPNVPSGAITAVSYRDGHTCKVAPRTATASQGSCPPVGYVDPPQPKLTASQLATPIQIKRLPGRSFCEKRGPILTSEQATSVKRCGAHVPAGYERIKRPSAMFQLSFPAPVAIEGARGRYEIHYRFPRNAIRRKANRIPGCNGGATSHGEATNCLLLARRDPNFCNDGGGMSSEMEYDAHRGQLMVERRTFAIACPGVIHGTVTYVRDNGPGGPGPIPAGREAKILVGRFSFKVP